MPAFAGKTMPSKNEAQKRALAHRVRIGLVGLVGFARV
jgi:preprotein translocase subunit Sss1